MNPTIHRSSILAALCLVLPLAAQEPAKLPPAWVEKSEPPADPDPASLPARPRKGTDKATAAAGRNLAAALDDPELLLFDQPEAGGALWARGHNFKASFDARGWTFIGKPRAGAPDLAPVAFRLSGARAGGRELAIAAALPHREGRRVTYAHGGLVQRLDLDGGGIEQSFVLDDLPARGEVVVEVEVTTTLAGRTVAGGIEFEGPWDHVTCSPAVAIDATGARTGCATTLEDGHIVIRVPAGFVERAVLPLVIDPRVVSAVISTSTSGDLGDPDVACLPQPAIVTPGIVDVWHVVYAHYFGGNDWDCYVQFLNANLVATGYQVVDFTTAGWERPRIASISQTSLIVAQVRSTGNPTKVAGRYAAAYSSNWTQFDISAASVESLRPDVGGDASGGYSLFRGTFYTVVWEHAYSATDHDIYARQIGGSGMGPLIYVQTNSLNQSNPSISKSCGFPEGPPAGPGTPSTQRFTLVWQQRVNAADEDIHGALLTWDGQSVPVGGNNTFPIDTSTARDTWPQASSPTNWDNTGRRRILVVYERTSSNAGDIAATCIDQQGAILARGNISALENDPLRLSWPQYRPSVDSDGYRFGVAYHELYGGNFTANDLDTRMSLVAFAGNRLLVEESGSVLGFSGHREFNVQVASRFSGDGNTAPRYCTTNDRDNVNTSNSFAIDAWTFTGVPADTFVSRISGCGTEGIVANGHSWLGATAQFSMSPNPYLCGYVVGSPVSTVIQGCPTCTLGVSGSSFIGNSCSLSIPMQLSLIGLPVSVQGFVFGHPSSPCFGQLMLTNTIDFTVQ